MFVGTWQDEGLEASKQASRNGQDKTPPRQKGSFGRLTDGQCLLQHDRPRDAGPVGGGPC